ncbi:hypothetical protein ACWIGW_41010 [Nocardia brasiliensis]
MRIVAALTNSTRVQEFETVTLINGTDAAIELDGWSLLDRDKNAMLISGSIEATATVRIQLAAPVTLPRRREVNRWIPDGP